MRAPDTRGPSESDSSASFLVIKSSAVVRWTASYPRSQIFGVLAGRSDELLIDTDLAACELLASGKDRDCHQRPYTSQVIWPVTNAIATACARVCAPSLPSAL